MFGKLIKLQKQSEHAKTQAYLTKRGFTVPSNPSIKDDDRCVLSKLASTFSKEKLFSLVFVRVDSLMLFRCK